MVWELFSKQETINIKKTDLKDVAWGVLQGSILGPVLFLIYVNDLQYASNLLDLIMFSDDTKTKYSFSYKPSKKDRIPLVLPKLSICNNEIKWSESIKFLGVFLDENLTWKDHIRYLENKIAKNLGLLFRSKPYLTKKCLLSLYHSYIYTYISYANIAWESTYISNLKKMNSQQKHAIRIIFSKKSMKH